VRRILDRIVAAGGTDLEAWESALRTAVLAAGARMLEGLLRGIGCGGSTQARCGCGSRMESRGRRRKRLVTMLGEVEYRRSRWECPSCGQRRYPGDEALDVEGTGFSPGVRRMLARVGSRSTFREGSEDLRVLAGLEVNAKAVERIAEGIGEGMEAWGRREREALIEESERESAVVKTVPVLYICADGTGVPMTREEVRGRRGKRGDGWARTREVKLGCVFTQTSRDARGFPLRDSDSTTFVGAIEEAEAFGWRLYGEALRRGLARAERVVVVADGAEWIRNLAEMHFPEAIQIVDLYHAREHVSDLCKLLFGPDEKRILRHRTRWWTWLDEGRVERIVRRARQKLPEDPDRRKRVETEIGYLEKNKARMRYADFRRQGLFVGSGVVEAGCKTVIGQRLKQSGMEWSLRGANAIIALRCGCQSGRFEDYWEARAA
jgi:hypothetical protein